MTSMKASLHKRVVGLGASAFRHYKRELHQYLLRRLHRPQDVDDLEQDRPGRSFAAFTLGDS